MRWLVLLVLCLAWASLPARAADRDTRAIEVVAGEDQVVEVGPIDEIVVVSADGVEVFQTSPTEMLVRADRPGAQAIVVLQGPSGPRSVVVRGLSPGAPTRPRPATAAEGPYNAELGLGGYYTYVVPGDPLVPALSLYHWADWQQAGDGWDARAYAGVVRTADGRWGVTHLRTGLETARLALELGDFDEVLSGSVRGTYGSAATIRGARASVSPTGSPLRVGILGGVYRPPVCCQFVEPSRLALGAATLAWAPAQGLWGQLTSGISKTDGVPVSPLNRIEGGYRADRVSAGALISQSGPGVSGTLGTDVQITEQIGAYAAAAGTSPGFRQPALPQPAGAEVGGLAGLRFSPASTATVRVEVHGLQRAESESRRSYSQFVGHADVRWAPLPSFDLYSAYERFQTTVGGLATSGDNIALGLGGRILKRLSLGASGRLVLQSPGDDQYFLGAYSGVRIGRTHIVASYRLDNPAVYWSQVARLGVVSTPGPLRIHLDAQYVLRRKETLVQPSVSLFGDVTWRFRRLFEIGVGASVTMPLPSSRPTWGLNASWSFYPGGLTREGGGLGFLGGIGGVVYLDRNYNGIQDDTEEGLPQVTVTVDGARQVQTDDEGRYHVGGLSAGSHTLSFDRDSFHALQATARRVEVSPLGHAREDLGLIWGGRVQGLLYVDLHDDGRFDNGDLLVPIEEVMLRDDRGVVVARTAAPQGRYTFSGLAEGEYTVILDPIGLPPGYRPLDDLEPEVFVEEGRPLTVSVRLQALRTVGGVVWEDIDRDGQGGGKRDLGIGGVEVYLSNGLVTRTGPDGSFQFRDLPPGGYAVRTELSETTHLVVLPVTPKENLDLTFVLPRGTRPPEQNIGDGRRPPPSGVAGLVLEAPIDVLPQGVSLQVTATAVLSNGETREVSSRAAWASSDEATLTVSEDGTVRGRRAGSAGVTAEWKGGVADPLTFEVLDDPLDEIRVSPVGLRLNPGDTAELRVDVLDRAGRGGEVTPLARWSVADPSIARIDREGVLRALRDGATTVQARIGDAWSPPLEVQVVTASVTALSIEGVPARMPEGASTLLRATGYDTQLQVLDVSDQVTWSSSNPDVLAIDDIGRITAVSRGTAQITASIGSLFTRSRSIAVTNTPPLALEVLPPGMTLRLDDRQKFRARATFEDGSRGSVTGVVEWIVDGTAADIRQDGTVVPREAGTMTVRARYLGVESAPVTVTVER